MNRGHIVRPRFILNHLSFYHHIVLFVDSLLQLIASTIIRTNSSSFISVLKSVITLTSYLSSRKSKIEMMLILIEFSFDFISLVYFFSTIFLLLISFASFQRSEFYHREFKINRLVKISSFWLFRILLWRIQSRNIWLTLTISWETFYESITNSLT